MMGVPPLECGGSQRSSQLSSDVMVTCMGPAGSVGGSVRGRMLALFSFNEYVSQTECDDMARFKDQSH